ncbi:MAG: cytochrome c oxidase accessory protein CcoG [Methyloceanibacter sp.]
MIEAAPGIEQIDVRAVNAKANRSLYAARVKIHPKRAEGRFRTIKWIVMAVTLGIYYLMPWLRWDRGPYIPDQAVLIDFPSRRFYWFFLEIWPQEFYYITGLLVLAALALFLVTSIAGRVWCGYTCPQTVWTDLMIAVERFFQGDRNARMRLDKSPWTREKIWRKGATHLTWLLIAIATGGAFVFYFADAPTLARQLATFEAPLVAYAFLGIFTATTYVLGGIAREQVCTYMCPWPRIQGAMFDRDSLLISYRDWRGEARGPHKAGQSWEGRGDCIDCHQCVAVCPAGIDIRDGAQLECIQCALCIDACDEIMDKVARPRGLIAYDTLYNLAAAGQEAVPIKLLRPRVLLYATAMAIVAVVMVTALLLRPDLEVSVLHDRNPIYVRLSDGGLRNGYTVKLLNKLYEPRSFRLALEGLPGASLSLIGFEHQADPAVTVPPDDLQSLRLYVTLDKSGAASLREEATDFSLLVTDAANGDHAEHKATFRGPER